MSKSRKGKASEAAVDLTTQRRAMQPSWMQVNMCIRHVFTWGTGSVSLHSGHPAPTHTYGNVALQGPVILLSFVPFISSRAAPPDPPLPSPCLSPAPCIRA